MDPHPQTTAILQQVFPGVEPDTAQMLQTMARRAEYEAGVLLCRQGAVEDTFYIILDGAVDVSQEIDNGRERHLATLAAGGYFGEMGLLDNRPRLANVTTRVPTTVLEIDGATLQRVIEASPQIGHELTRRILAILRANDENLWKAVLEKEAAQKELEIGRRIQQSFLPPDMPRLPGWEIISHLQPAGVVSGDFYDAMVFDDSRVLLVLGDVCDKGVGAALYMALFRSLVRAFAEHHYHSHRREREQGQSAAESIVAAMRDTLQQTILFTNSYLTRHHARTNMFATLFFAILEPDSGYVAYVNGGHEPPVVTGPEGIRCRLSSTGPLVGIIPDVSYDVGEIWLAEGETMLAFTDGVTEATDADKQIFGREQVMALLQEPDASAAALVERISAAIRAHTTSAPQSDDITMLAVRRLEASGS
ncbi:MAG: SpoIIE family protein phosphatase [Chloroflexi bacterium]|nr:SpoIIE family protein phosphatase [Chloroflexota bacterium]